MLNRYPTTAMLMLFLLVFAGSVLAADPVANKPAPYAPNRAVRKTQQWFQDAKFGIFIHFGPASARGDGDQFIPLFQAGKLTMSEYQKIIPQFNPAQFDPAAWVSLFKKAGARYITFTSKHHDGFCMWDAKTTDFNLVAQTPYKRDLLKLLADECRKQDMPLSLYYSRLDFHHPDYSSQDEKIFNRYLDYQDAQIKELLGGRYGRVRALWIDGWWDQNRGESRRRPTYDLIHKLQPGVMIGNNHHQLPYPGEDFQMYERASPSGDKRGKLPVETCDVITPNWFYSPADKLIQSPEQVIQNIARHAGYDSNYMLDIPPMPDGRIPPDAIALLEKVGAWLEKNGKSIYGTRGGPMPPQSWGVMTRSGKNLYVHVFGGTRQITLPGTADLKVVSARRLDNGNPVSFSKSPDLKIELTGPLDSVDTIIVLKTK